MPGEISKTVKTWEATSVQGIYRHKSGRLYARIYADGREKWESLQTPLMEVAKARFRQQVGALEIEAKAKAAAKSGRMLVKDAILLFKERLQTGLPLSRKPKRTKGRAVTASTIKFRLETLAALCRSWPELEESDVRKISARNCEEWGDRYALEVSPSRFNSTLDTLWHIFNQAVQANAITENPAESIGRCGVSHAIPTMPTTAEFQSFVQAMRKAGGRFSKQCADFVEFMAYTGTRKNEAAHVEWRDVDLAGRRIHVRITKNGLPRVVPMIAPAEVLLKKMRDERPGEAPIQRVFQVRESQKAIDRAAKQVGMTRITHHSLRHLFATVSMESGVDIPTISRWLGHKDGGALAMKTYGHLRDEHSRAAAQRVTFAAAT